MDSFYRHVYKTYGVAVIGKHQLALQIKSVIYGTMTSFLDLTREFKNEFLHDDHLQVPSDVSLNRSREY